MEPRAPATVNQASSRKQFPSAPPKGERRPPHRGQRWSVAPAPAPA